MELVQLPFQKYHGRVLITDAASNFDRHDAFKGPNSNNTAESLDKHNSDSDLDQYHINDY